VIIRTEQGRMRFITQHDHAAIAAELAAAWGGAEFAAPEPLGALKLAALIHDQGWQEWDQQPALRPETGRPYDFLNIPVDQHLAIYERCVRLAVAEHPYAGLLVSLHGAGLYRARYGHMPHLPEKPLSESDKLLVEQFLARQEALQQELLADLQPDQAALWTHYRWLQAWDAISVFACFSSGSDRRTFQAGTMPRWPGGPEEPIVMTGAGGSVFTISPWPFTSRQIDLFLPVRWLPDRPYESDAQFYEEYAATPTQSVHVTLRPNDQ
jgi:hypothetical protein